eukprot:1215232-Pleurochrysis_carterae.AAC.1
MMGRKTGNQRCTSILRGNRRARCKKERNTDNTPSVRLVKSHSKVQMNKGQQKREPWTAACAQGGTASAAGVSATGMLIAWTQLVVKNVTHRKWNCVFWSGVEQGFFVHGTQETAEEEYCTRKTQAPHLPHTLPITRSI